jgi:hypothetical protein
MAAATKAEEYWAKAEECVRLAEKLNYRPAKAEMLEVARHIGNSWPSRQNVKNGSPTILLTGH